MKLDARATLEFRQEQIKEQIAAALDLLQGYVHRSPSQGGYHYMTRVGDRKTTKYVRKRLLPQVQAMIQNHRRVQQLLRQLSELNWRLLHLED